MPPSLLIVDDEWEASDAIKMFLELQGFTVRVSYSGMEAVNALKESVPDLILLDLQMPGMDGWQTLKQMRQITPQVKVVILTGSVPNRELEELAVQEGAIGILTKPIPVHVLPDKIRSFMQGGKP